ncbi:hypothetical protein L411_00306 [Escherichia coli BWH 24]|nr:hypothetical protein L411_00306 [Escherichia coli BWH 24]
MLPAQRRQELQQLAVHRLAGLDQPLGGAFQVHRVPQHDSRRHQVEAAGPVALLLEAPIPDFPRRLKNTALASELRASPLFRPACTRRRSSTLCSQSRMNSVRSIRPARAGPRPVRSGAGSCRALRSISEAVTVPCLIELARRRMSSQWARTCLMFQGAADQRAQRRVGLHALRHVQLGFAESRMRGAKRNLAGASGQRRDR